MPQLVRDAFVASYAERSARSASRTRSRKRRRNTHLCRTRTLRRRPGSVAPVDARDSSRSSPRWTPRPHVSSTRGSCRRASHGSIRSPDLPGLLTSRLGPRHRGSLPAPVPWAGGAPRRTRRDPLDGDREREDARVRRGVRGSRPHRAEGHGALPVPDQSARPRSAPGRPRPEAHASARRPTTATRRRRNDRWSARTPTSS